MNNSSACAVVAVAPEDGLVLLPVAVLVWSRVTLVARPENSSAVAARALAEGCVMVMVAPDERAATLWAVRMTVRTPLVPLPFATSASTL
jgi:hypothetical protein